MQFSDWIGDRSQSEIARQIGVTRQFVSQLANGKRTPSLSMVLVIRDLTSGKVKPEDWPRKRNGAGAAA